MPQIYYEIAEENKTKAKMVSCKKHCTEKSHQLQFKDYLPNVVHS